MNAIRKHKARRTNDTIMRLMENEDFMKIFEEKLDWQINITLPTLTSELASEIDCEKLADYILLRELVSEMDMAEIACELDRSDIASYFDFDATEVAEHFSVSQIADQFEAYQIAEHIDISAEDVTSNIDIDSIRSEIRDEVMMDLQSEKEDMISQVIDEIIGRLGGE
jgi:hypothetical protein